MYFGMHDMVAWEDVEACLLMAPLKISWLKCESSIRYKRKLQFSSNSLKIGLSSVNLSVPTFMEGLDGVDGREYQWFLLEEQIISCIACALSEISIEMIASTFLKSIRNMIFNACFVKRHPSFSASFLCLKCSLKIGVHIIHGPALYMHLLQWMKSKKWLRNLCW